MFKEAGKVLAVEAMPASDICCHGTDLAIVDTLGNAIHHGSLPGTSTERPQRRDEILARQIIDRGDRPLALPIRAVTGGTGIDEGRPVPRRRVRRFSARHYQPSA